MFSALRPSFSAIASLEEGRSYASVVERNRKRKNYLTEELIAFFSKVLEEGKELIKREEGRIVVQTHEDVMDYIKTFEVGNFGSPLVREVLSHITEWLDYDSIYLSRSLKYGALEVRYDDGETANAVSLNPG